MSQRWEAMLCCIKAYTQRKKYSIFHSAIRIENFLNKFQTWKLNLEAFYPNDFIDSVSI